MSGPAEIFLDIFGERTTGLLYGVRGGGGGDGDGGNSSRVVRTIDHARRKDMRYCSFEIRWQSAGAVDSSNWAVVIIRQMREGKTENC